MCKQAKFALKKMLNGTGYSEAAANELWKWYDFSKKKGAASF